MAKVTKWWPNTIPRIKKPGLLFCQKGNIEQTA
jgi:hypothetical protein